MLRRCQQWWREWVQCWRLARLIQRKERIAVTPDFLASLTASVAARPAVALPAEPDPSVSPTDRYVIQRNRDGVITPIYATDDAGEAKRRYDVTTVSSGSVEFWDRKLGISRAVKGSR